MVKIVSFSGAFSHTCEHGVTSMSFGDVVNQFLDEHGFSDSGSSEKPDFTSSGIRSQQIHNLNLQVSYLNSRDKQFGT